MSQANPPVGSTHLERLVGSDTSGNGALTGVSAGSARGNSGFPGLLHGDDGDPRDFDWRQLLSILRRRRRLAITSFCVVLGLAILFTLLAPKKYGYKMDVLVNPSSGNAMSQMSNSLPALSTILQSTQGQSVDTEVEILQSSSVLADAVKRLPASMQEEARHHAGVSANQVGPANVIRVSVTSHNIALTVAFAQAICQAYIEQNQLQNSAVYRGTADFVKRQLDDVRNSLDKSSAALRDYKQKNNIVDISTEGQARIAALAALHASLNQAISDREAGETQLARLQAQVARMKPVDLQSTTTVPSPVAQALQQQLITLQAQKFAAQQEFTPNSPEVLAIDEQINALQRRLRTVSATEVGSAERNQNPVRQHLVEAMAQLEGQNSANVSRAGILNAQIAQMQLLMKQLPAREYRLGQLLNKQSTLQTTYQSLSDKYETLRISQEAPLSNARVISSDDKAKKVSPRTVPNIMLGIIFGLLFATGICLAADRLDDGVHNEEDAWQATHLPVLAQVPMVSKDGNPLIVGEGSKHALLLESYRMLRTRLAFSSPGNQIKSIVVTSALPHEGKSTTATNLAVALALNGHSVILLDADLRRPSLHRILGRERGVGFSNVIAGLLRLDEVIQETDIENLRIVQAGPTPPNPPELLDSANAREVIEALKAQTDFLIIDSPPALLLTDAQILAHMVDGVLLVVSSQEASKRAAAKTSELMAISGTRILGTVLTKMTQGENPYYYGYGRYGSYGYSAIQAYSGYLDTDSDDPEKSNGNSSGSK